MVDPGLIALGESSSDQVPDFLTMDNWSAIALSTSIVSAAPLGLFLCDFPYVH
jgi:hypothetical protein